MGLVVLKEAAQAVFIMEKMQNYRISGHKVKTITFTPEELDDLSTKIGVLHQHYKQDDGLLILSDDGFDLVSARTFSFLKPEKDTEEEARAKEAMSNLFSTPSKGTPDHKHVYPTQDQDPAKFPSLAEMMEREQRLSSPSHLSLGPNGMPTIEAMAAFAKDAGSDVVSYRTKRLMKSAIANRSRKVSVAVEDIVRVLGSRAPAPFKNIQSVVLLSEATISKERDHVLRGPAWEKIMEYSRELKVHGHDFLDTHELRTHLNRELGTSYDIAHIGHQMSCLARKGSFVPVGMKIKRKMRHGIYYIVDPDSKGHGV